MRTVRMPVKITSSIAFTISVGIGLGFQAAYAPDGVQALNSVPAHALDAIAWAVVGTVYLSLFALMFPSWLQRAALGTALYLTSTVAFTLILLYHRAAVGFGYPVRSLTTGTIAAVVAGPLLATLITAVMSLIQGGGTSNLVTRRFVRVIRVKRASRSRHGSIARTEWPSP